MTTATAQRFCIICNEPIDPIRVELNSRRKTCSKRCSAINLRQLRNGWNKRDRARKSAERALQQKEAIRSSESPVEAARRARGVLTDRRGRVLPVPR